MNLRYHNNQSTLIHQLAHQAHDETNVLYHERLKTEHPAEVIFYDMFNQRFAELIVRECMALCKSMDETDTRYRYDYRRGVLDCVDTIKQHFGVEE